MKRLFLFLGFAMAMSGCSEEGKQTSNDNARINSYLSHYYNSKFELGDAVQTKLSVKNILAAREAETEDVIVTEVYVGDDERARGYIITSKDSNTFLYFVDVDRENYKMMTDDIVANDKKYFENIDQMDRWASSNQFDFIQVTNDYLAEMAAASEADRRPFWGWTGWRPMGDCSGGMVAIVNTHYIFGIRNTIAYDLVPCGTDLSELENP